MVYDGDALVDHEVTADRLSRRWLLRRACAQGVDNVWIDKASGGADRRECLRQVKALGRQAVRGWRRAARAVRTGASSQAALIEEAAGQALLLGALYAQLSYAARGARR
jgi:hypothetical protein